jgi:hypothetical protein
MHQSPDRRDYSRAPTLMWSVNRYGERTKEKAHRCAFDSTKM